MSFQTSSTKDEVFAIPLDNIVIGLYWGVLLDHGLFEVVEENLNPCPNLPS